MVGRLTATEFNLLDAISVLDGLANKTSIAIAAGMKEESVRRAMLRCRDVGLVKEICYDHKNRNTTTVYFEASALGKRLFAEASERLCV